MLPNTRKLSLPFLEHNMHKSGLFLFGIVLAAACLARSDDSKNKPRSKSKPEPKRIVIEDLVTTAPLPAEYVITRKDITDGDKLLGHKLFLTKGEQVSKAIVTVETRKITKREEKVAARKGYVNGLAQTFREAGLKLVEKQIPEIDKNDFAKRLTVDLVYEKPDDGSKLYLQIQVFFTDLGYSVAVISDNKADHDVLTKWASSVQAK